MRRIDNASSVAGPPAYPAAGPNLDFIFGEPVPGQGTIVDAWWATLIQEEIANVVEGAGLTLANADDTQLTTVVGGAAAIKSHATDTGSVSTLHNHAVIASASSTARGALGGDLSAVIGSSGSQATGDNAVDIGGTTNIISGDKAVAIGCDQVTLSGNITAGVAAFGGTVSGDVAAVIASTSCTLPGIGSAILASDEVELATAKAIGGGDGAAMVPSGSNQNLEWLIESNGGNAHFGGTVKVGGNVDAGTGAKVTLTGSSGDIDCDGDLNVGTNADVTGTLDVTGRTTIEKLDVGSTYLFRSTADHTGGSALGVGAWGSINVAGLPVDSGSQIRFVMGSVDAVTCEVVMGSVSLNGTTATIRYWNEGSSGAYNNYLYFDVFVVNPS
jgi:hypothetical protein